MAAWSESTSSAGHPQLVDLHGNCCHTSSGFPGGRGRKQSRELHRGRPHLLLCLQLCILIWVGETDIFENSNICCRTKLQYNRCHIYCVGQWRGLWMVRYIHWELKVRGVNRLFNQMHKPLLSLKQASCMYRYEGVTQSNFNSTPYDYNLELTLDVILFIQAYQYLWPLLCFGWAISLLHKWPQSCWPLLSKHLEPFTCWWESTLQHFCLSCSPCQRLRYSYIACTATYCVSWPDLSSFFA